MENEKPRVILWRPHPGKQELFHECPAYEVLFGGTKGPGKTECLLREGLRQVSHPEYRAIIFRRTFPRLGEVIDRSFKYFKGLGAKYSDHDLQLKLPAWTFPTPDQNKFVPGAKFAFGHVQHEKDKWNYHGKQFQYLGFDEIAEFTESQYLFLLGINRTPIKEIWCYVRSTANPGGVGHGWVKKRWIDAFRDCPVETIKYFKRVDDEDVETDEQDEHSISRAFIPANIYDNPSIVENDPAYLKRLEQLPELDKKAFLYGDWEVFQGQFFKDWRRLYHVKEIEILPHYSKFLSLDYGFACPSSVGWWCVDESGHLHRYRELYKEGLTYEKLARLVREMTPADERIDYCVADPAIWGDKSRHSEDMKGESGAETMQREWMGFTGLLKADNSRITGWGRMRIMLEQQRISCSSNCKDSIRTIPNLVHSDSNVEDLNSDGEDHAADDWRYAVMSRPQVSSKPIPRSRDKAKPLAYELIEDYGN